MKKMDEEKGKKIKKGKGKKKKQERIWTKGWKGEEACKLACGADSI